MAPLVSVVIPVLRDAPALDRLLTTLAPATSSVETDDVAYEVIVVNGDRDDRTLLPLRDRHPSVRWTTTPSGRARQMNAGARIACGQWLLFLHADTRPASGWLDEIQRVSKDSEVSIGAFRFTLSSQRSVARLLEWGVAWRVRRLGLPYGDQGLFIRRTAFDQLGGYRLVPLMEDVDLVRRARTLGRLAAVETPIVVSPRRWERDGWITRTAANLLLLVLYTLGVSPRRLARLYYGEAPRRSSGLHAASVSRHPSGVRSHRLVVVVPALNEADAIGEVLDDIPAEVSSIIVVDNGSTDATATVARGRGAEVVTEPRRGYGRACQTGLAAAVDADIVVFLDADRSDYPAEMLSLVAPIVDDEADLVMGARRGVGRPMTARLGTALCVALINRLWRTDYSDLGPFRAIGRDALERLRMSDEAYGWTIEMQVRAAEENLRVLELPIRQRPRVGHSKISGTVMGTARAGRHMLGTIWALWRTRRTRQ